MANFHIPTEYPDFGPLVVTSPTTRCGTTLLQRLISDSSNAFIYGEEIGRQLNQLTEQFMTVIGYSRTNEQSLNDGFRRALEGALDEWRPGLTPPTEVMLKAWSSLYYQMPATLSAFGKTIDRPIWGFKWPGQPASSIRGLLTLMPASRIIYLVRHPEQALMSAKARRFVKTTEDAVKFCSAWSANLQEMLVFQDDRRVLWLRYEDLLAEKERTLKRIEIFCGVHGMKLDAFAVKVNTFVGEESEGRSPTQYIAPAALTPAELDAVRHFSGALVGELYPKADPRTAA